jgi:predicted  nucleic acid-binding Zn-ribbon protein
MDNQNNKEITNADILESLNRSFSKIEEKIDGINTDLSSFKIETNLHLNNLESDLKSFKKDTQDGLNEIKERLDDQHETVMSFDKRIEILEDKVLV